MRAKAAGGSLVFLVIAPGVVAGLVPWLLTGWNSPGEVPAPLVAAGVMVLAVGVAVLLHAFARFVVEGLGTPAPVAPPRHLVVGGLYRYVRNPMYLAVAAIIVGQAMILGRWELLLYAIAFGIASGAFSRLYEEPTLARQFGSEYDAYRRAVPAWWPRRRPWSHSIEVADEGRTLGFTYDDMLRHHGGGSPGGVAHAFKVLERALPLLDPDGPCERREIVVETAFGGPGARDALELVTGAVSGGRFRIDESLARPERGRTRERFVFRLSYRERSVTLELREGFVTEEFIDLARTEGRGPAEERRLDTLKQEMAERVMARAADEVYAAD